MVSPGNQPILPDNSPYAERPEGSLEISRFADQTFGMVRNIS